MTESRSRNQRLRLAYLLRALPLFFLIYVWIRGLTANPIGPYALSLYQEIPADLLLGLGLAGLSLLLISKPHTNWAAILVPQFLIAITILPTLQTKFLHLTPDAYMHIGRVNRILATGSSAERNLYPLLHWLSAMIVEITGLTSTKVAILLTVVCSATLGLLSVLCIHRLALPKSVYPLGIFAAMLMCLNFDIYNFASWGQLGRLFVVLTALILFIDSEQASRQLERRSILLLIIAAIAFAHPILWVIISGILLIILSYQLLSGSSVYRVVYGSFILLPSLIIALYWLLNAPTFSKILSSILGSILAASSSSSRLARRTGQLSSADIAPIDIAIQFIGQYGYLVFFLGSLLVLIALRTIAIRGRDSRLQPLAIGVVILWATGAVTFTLPVPFGPSRFWGISIILGVFVAAQDLADLITRRGSRKTVIIGLSLVVLILVYAVAAPTIYGSTLARSPSEQMTKAKFSGTEWLFTYEDSEDPIRAIGVNVRNLIAYQETSDSYRSAPKPEPHFAKIRSGEFSGYVLIAPPAGQTYPTYYAKYPETWDYTPEDYFWLEHSTATSHIYTSGDTSIRRANMN